MSTFSVCVAIFVLGLVIAFGFAWATLQLAAVLRINLACADRMIVAQEARIRQLQQEAVRMRDRLARFGRTHGPGGRFTRHTAQVLNGEKAA